MLKQSGDIFAIKATSDISYKAESILTKNFIFSHNNKYKKFCAKK